MEVTEALQVEDNVRNVLSAPRAIRFTTLTRSKGAEIYVLTRPGAGESSAKLQKIIEEETGMGVFVLEARAKGCKCFPRL